MSEFDDIRPFDDDEVPAVVRRIVDNPELPRAAAKLVMPRLLQTSTLGQWLTRMILRRRSASLNTVRDCQLLLEGYFDRLVNETISELTVSGIENLQPDKAYLFVSNHRDIVMDSGLLNFLLHKHGHDTCRMAVGDNLLSNALAADLMRLNKSFVIEREISGAKAVLKSLSHASQYIRHSLDENVSIWIAQREGRAKDGLDRTDPALLKMLALAHKDVDGALNALIRRHPLVPVSVSYEIDPCAPGKARELYSLATRGEYKKSDEEDLQSIIRGITGYKGRVHLAFHKPMAGDFTESDRLAEALDHAIVGGLKVYPTHVAAAQQLGCEVIASCDMPPNPEATAVLNQQIAVLSTREREYLLRQYANVIVNRRELGFV